MRTNIFAFTEQPDPDKQYPAFVSLNRETDGSYSLTVRGEGQAQTVLLTPDQLRNLGQDIHYEFNAGSGG